MTNNATLAFNHADTLSYGGVIGGNGSLAKQGSGMLILTASNTFTGGAAISAGRSKWGTRGPWPPDL